MLYVFGPFRLDPSLPLLMREGETVAVPPRALAGLTLLVQRRHTAVSKRELMDAVWPESFVEEGSLAQMISVLRKALTADFAESPIRTISKLGYRFVAHVEEVPLATLPPFVPGPIPLQQTLGIETPTAPDTQPVSVPQGRPSRRGLAWAVPLAGFLAAIVAFMAVHWPHVPGKAATRTTRRVIAVLPFQNLSGASNSAWIGVAAQQMLSTDLRLSQGFRVLATEDVNRAMDEVHPGTSDLGATTLRRLGNDLGCEQAVVGAYLLNAGQVRLDVRVVNLATGATEKENTFERPENSLLPMLADVSSRTAINLGVSPDGDQPARMLADGMDPAAYKLFAEAVARNRVYDFKGVIDLLQQSIALDPSFSLAHEELSIAWSARGQEKQAIVEGERALQLSVRLPREQQLSIQARLQSARHQFAEAAETYRALFRVFPDNREYGRLLIQSLSSAGESDQALDESQKLLASSEGAANDPLLLSVIADMYSTLGNWPGSLEWSKRGADESRRRGATILYERLLTTESQANLHMGQYGVAENQTREALTLARQFHDVSGELRALNRLGEIATAQKDWPAAESALLAAVDLEHTYDQPQRQTHTLLTLSRLSQTQANLPKAYTYGKQALALAQTLGFADAITEAKLQMAVVVGTMGHRAAAMAQLAEVRSEAEGIHDAYLQGEAQRALEVLKIATR